MTKQLHFKGADMIGRIVFVVALCGSFAFTAPSRAATLPDSIRSAGVINLGVSPTYAPLEYKDPATNKLIGMDVDLGDELARHLGVKAAWTESTMAQITPGLQTGRVDLIISGISDVAARREAMDFVDYMKTGAAFLTLSTSPLTSQADLCGKRAATGRASSFPSQIRDWSSKNCEAAGKPALTVADVESSADGRQQMKQGRVDVVVQGFETVPYFMGLEPGVYKQIGTPFTTLYQGMGAKKGNTDLLAAVANALQAMIKDGSYKAILAKWKLGDTAIDAAMINGQPVK
jgi:polar amino acid transport system substrate-binding protein